jgi:hypothetical protein
MQRIRGRRSETMRLKSFKVKMYRPILDSGWVHVDDIAVIVGKNESGKTAILKALHKFKLLSPNRIPLEREWPRGHRRERLVDAIVVQTHFEFESIEADTIAEFFPGEKGPQASRYPRHTRAITDIPFYLKSSPHKQRQITSFRICAKDCGLVMRPLPNLKRPYRRFAIKPASSLKPRGHLRLVEKMAHFKALIEPAVQADNENDKTESVGLKTVLDEIAKLADVVAALPNWDRKWLFVYMDVCSVTKCENCHQHDNSLVCSGHSLCGFLRKQMKMHQVLPA